MMNFWPLDTPQSIHFITFVILIVVATFVTIALIWFYLEVEDHELLVAVTLGSQTNGKGENDSLFYIIYQTQHTDMT
jgi:hypothetical protein